MLVLVELFPFKVVRVRVRVRVKIRVRTTFSVVAGDLAGRQKRGGGSGSVLADDFIGHRGGHKKGGGGSGLGRGVEVRI